MFIPMMHIQNDVQQAQPRWPAGSTAAWRERAELQGRAFILMQA